MDVELGLCKLSTAYTLQGSVPFLELLGFRVQGIGSGLRVSFGRGRVRVSCGGCRV